MKKNLIILAPLILILIGFLGYKFLNKKGTPSLETPTSKTQLTTTPTSTPKTTSETEITNRENLVCRYQPEEKIEILSYIKGNKIFSEIKGENQEFDRFLFFDDTKKIYYWNSNRKQGFILTASAIQPNTQFNLPSTDEYLDEMEKYKLDCRKENLSDTLFDIPSDVKFEDMNKLQEMMRQNQ